MYWKIITETLYKCKETRKMSSLQKPLWGQNLLRDKQGEEKEWKVSHWSALMTSNTKHIKSKYLVVVSNENIITRLGSLLKYISWFKILKYQWLQSAHSWRKGEDSYHFIMQEIYPSIQTLWYKPFSANKNGWECPQSDKAYLWNLTTFMPWWNAEHVPCEIMDNGRHCIWCSISSTPRNNDYFRTLGHFFL